MQADAVCIWCCRRALAEDLEADLTRVMKLHQFVQVVSAACRTLAALAGLVPKVCPGASIQEEHHPRDRQQTCRRSASVLRLVSQAESFTEALTLRGSSQVGARLAATAAAVAEKMAGPPSERPTPNTYIAKLQSAGTNAKELRVRRLQWLLLLLCQQMMWARTWCGFAVGP